MDRNDEYLRARGWEWRGLEGWVPPMPFPGTKGQRVGVRAALEIQRTIDRSTVDVMGSVIYRPTAEQARTSPLLAACAARGMCERDVIEHLRRESAAYRRSAAELASLQPPPAIHISGEDGAKLLGDLLKRAQAIGDAWKALAKARGEDMRAVFACDFVEARKAREDIDNASEDLRTLGIDPDAEEETGR